MWDMARLWTLEKLNLSSSVVLQHNLKTNDHFGFLFLSGAADLKEVLYLLASGTDH